ncbi:PREDICTED: receptor-like protein kinase FERONIA [Theobroma cacao]|uniref:Receptor-like protein kinase FERONIA n=1 Tax=Theobroma cacao TaxID=3641 RepID=A0AB32W8K2_THECC|nr:PREDICTED: receptor-like protein kinase FERONIA [Theobroma cacao]
MENISVIFPITFLVTFLQFAFFIASERPPYVPTDNITLNCGALSDSHGSDGRFWAGDKSSKFGPVESSRTIPSAPYEADNQGGSVETVPYMTARVSSSEFKYSFPVSPGQKFVRLHFYPASYKKFDRSKAFFSVKAGSFTLLKNFSAFLVAESSNVKSFFREFCLNVEENQVLELIFTPTPSSSNDTYAFINGIEIVSMPSNLYYTPSDSLDGARFIGQKNGFYVDNYTALETVYRLNVGGKSISQTEDTGMFRLWSDDYDYILSESYFTVNTTVPLKYTMIPKYTAPEEVYQTARTMGPNGDYNRKHNITWGLPVDSGFRYMVRLHFCEFQDVISSAGIRQFEIFINNQTAEAFFDVIIWTQQSNVPIYKDYVLLMSKKEENKQDITIALHPRVAKKYDVILNGIEVFKVNGSDGNVAGPNPELLLAPPPPESFNYTSGKSKTKRRVLIVGGGCAVGLLTLLSLLICMVVWRHRKRKYYGSYSGANWFCWCINPNKGKSTKSSLLPEELCRHFSLDEIKAATNNFHDDLVIGKGGFGKVYKGFLDEGETIVAIKRLNPESRQGVSEFLTEIEMLSQLRHVHLVSLIGYCNENREMILVYDFMSNGTLSDHLYGTSYDCLTWKQRLEICKGAAIGLNYLHTEVKYTVIHRDVKTSNILLDEKFTAKVSDFGLSKTDPKVDMLNTGIKGTLGYLDPEYARGHSLTEKSDVYSFGVVLFEVLCARKALDKKLPEGQVNLAHWARNCIADGTLYQVIDPYLIGKMAPECFKVFVEIAENCTAESGAKRPSMNEVMEKLRFAMDLQEAADLEKEKINPGGEHRYPDIVFPVARDIDIEDESELESELDMDSSIYNGFGILDSNITGMTYTTIDTSTSSDLFSSTNNSKSIVN